MPDEEIIDKIILLFALHVPDSLDKRQVLDRLAQRDTLLFRNPKELCPECKKPLICLDCEDISADVEATIRINGRTIYA
jgi:uncharacterized protein with PIN domain